jgi:hypothetical protein
MAGRTALGATALACALGAGAASAELLASGTVEVSTAAGSIALASRLYDGEGGDPSRWRFEYELSGDYDPFPGESNELSSLGILFAGSLGDVADETAPAGWVVDCCLAVLPFGVGFGIDNATGSGIGSGESAIFSFSAPAGVPWTDLPAGSYAGTHVGDVATGFVDLVDDESGAGPIVPAPEPDGLGGAAVAALAAARRRGPRQVP